MERSELNWSWFFRHEFFWFFHFAFLHVFFVFDTQTLIAGFCVVTSSTERLRWKNSFRFSFAPRSNGFENCPIEFFRYSYLLKFTCSLVVRFFTALYVVPIYELNINPSGESEKTNCSLQFSVKKLKAWVVNSRQNAKFEMIWREASCFLLRFAQPFFGKF